MDARGKPQYPSCEKISTALTAKYGVPTRVEEFMEEEFRNRRLTLTGDGEEQVLLCFRDEGNLSGRDEHDRGVAPVRPITERRAT